MMKSNCSIEDHHGLKRKPKFYEDCFKNCRNTDEEEGKEEGIGRGREHKNPVYTVLLIACK